MNLFLIVLSLIVCLSECLSVSRELKKKPICSCDSLCHSGTHRVDAEKSIKGSFQAAKRKTVTLCSMLSDSSSKQAQSLLQVFR